MNSQLTRASAAIAASILATFAAASETAPRDLHYALTLVAADPPRVRATIELIGDADGVTTLSLPGGERDLQPGTTLTAIEAFAADGVALESRRTQPHRIEIVHAPDASLSVAWDIEHAMTSPPNPPGGDYRTVLEPERFHALGNRVLFAPEREATDATIRFQWRGFDEAGWSTVCSHGVGAGPFEFRGDVELFRHAIFMAGDLAIEHREIPGGSLAVAVANEHEFDFETGDLADLAARIVTFEREFMRDETGAFYLVTMTSQGAHRRERGLALGGTGLSNSFAIFVPPGMSLDETNGDFARFCHLLAHEHYHEWNGLRIRRAQPENLAFWFSEGFTEFLTRRILHRSGLVSRDASLEDFNRSIRDYFTNPRRNATNQEIADGFFADMTLSFVPYRRGDLIAAIVDHEIRDASEGERSLDDFMRALKAAKEPVTTESLIATIEQWTSPAVASHVRDVVVDGVDPVFPDDFFAAELASERIEFFPCDPGFDVMATVRGNEMTGVVNGGKAHAAGLREGMKVLGLGYDSSAPERPIPIQVEIDGEVKSITIDPRLDPIRAPRFSRREGTSAAPSFP